MHWNTPIDLPQELGKYAGGCHSSTISFPQAGHLGWGIFTKKKCDSNDIIPNDTFMARRGQCEKGCQRTLKRWCHKCVKPHTLCVVEYVSWATTFSPFWRRRLHRNVSMHKTLCGLPHRMETANGAKNILHWTAELNNANGLRRKELTLLYCWV